MNRPFELLTEKKTVFKQTKNISTAAALGGSSNKTVQATPSPWRRFTAKAPIDGDIFISGPLLFSQATLPWQHTSNQHWFSGRGSSGDTKAKRQARGNTVGGIKETVVEVYWKANKLESIDDCGVSTKRASPLKGTCCNTCWFGDVTAGQRWALMMSSMTFEAVLCEKKTRCGW